MLKKNRRFGTGGRPLEENPLLDGRTESESKAASQRNYAKNMNLEYSKNGTTQV